MVEKNQVECNYSSNLEKEILSELIKKKFDENKIVPDIIKDYPINVVNVIFPSGVKISLGNKVSLYQIKLKPYILYWPVELNTLYTIAIIDLDFNKSNKKSFLLFLVMNIHANDVNKADILADYMPSILKDVDCHRIIILVFKQEKYLNVNQSRLEIIKINERKNFSLNKFIEKFSLGNPLFGNFFLTRSEQVIEKKS